MYKGCINIYEFFLLLRAYILLFQVGDELIEVNGSTLINKEHSEVILPQ